MTDQRKRENIHTRAPFDDGTARTRIDQRRLLNVVHGQTRAAEAIAHIAAKPARGIAALQELHEQVLQQEIIRLIAVCVVERQPKQLVFCCAKA